MSQFLTRREFLVGSLAAGISPSLERILQTGGFSFSFFSDTHVGLKANIDLNRDMLAEVRAMPIDFAVNGGDVTDYGWVGEYDNYWALIKDLPFKVHHIAGNHDVRWSPLGPKAYREGTRDALYKSFDHKGCHFALLDSTVPLSHWGHFESEMLRWLDADLKRVGRETPVFLFTHHWVGRDRIMVDNELALLKIIEPYNVKLIFNGHGHNDLLWTWDGIPGTMNRGLYQLSFQRVDVGDGKVVLSRRTKERPRMRELLTAPLKAGREKRQVWQMAPAELERVLGSPLVLGSVDVEHRWDDGPWQKTGEGPLVAVGAAGTRRISFRADDRTYFSGPVIVNKREAGVLKRRWERKLSGGIMSHLQLDNGVLYVSAMDGSLWALESRTGEPRWNAKTAGYCHSSPTLTEKAVIVGSADGSVYAFDRKSGTRLWRTATAGPVYASAALAKSIACVASGDGSVYGLDVNSGARKWRYDLPKSNTAFIQSPAATDGERFYLGAWDSHLYCLDAATGNLLWRKGCCADRSFAYSPAIGGPAIGDGKVYVPANGNVLYAFDQVSGEPVWESTAPEDKFGYSSPLFVEGRIYIGCLGDKGLFRCVDAKNGQILWSAETGSVIYDSSPSHADGIVAIGSVSGLLSAVRASDGHILGQYQMPIGHFLASPTSAPGAIYAGSYSDYVVAFDVL